MAFMFLNHISLLILFALVISVVFACLGKDSLKERILFALMLFAGLFVGGMVIAWIMFPFPG